MLVDPRQIHNLSDLRKFVSNILCEQEQLEASAYPMSERLLMRGERPCGIFFCVHGPRAVKVSAIWETDRNRLLFYDSTGQRFRKTQLDMAPALTSSAA